MNNVLRGKLGWQQDVYLSVYNPNRVAFEVDNIKLRFTYANLVVGKTTSERFFPPWIVQAGRVADYVLRVDFSPPFSVAKQMWYDYETTDLNMTVTASIYGSVGSVPYNVTESVSHYRSAEPPDTSLCLCP